MDKQKQIEEMVGDIAKVLSGVLVSEIINVAYFLDEQGYRKIPENAVVLTGDEYERWQGQTLNIKKVRKETAEKFAEKIFGLFPEDKNVTYIHRRTVEGICEVITEGNG